MDWMKTVNALLNYVRMAHVHLPTSWGQRERGAPRHWKMPGWKNILPREGEKEQGEKLVSN